MSELCIVPIVCLTDGCANRRKIINWVSDIPEEDIDLFFEGYDESCLEDHCPRCGALGVADDPVDEPTMIRLLEDLDGRKAGRMDSKRV